MSTSTGVTMRVTCRPESAIGGVLVRDKVGRVEDARTPGGGLVFFFPDRAAAESAASRVRTLAIAGLDVAITDDPEVPDYVRAGGDTHCERCGKAYFDHPDTEHTDHAGHRWLKRLCDGRFVKL